MTHEFTFQEWTFQLKSLAQTAATNMALTGTLREQMLAFRNVTKRSRGDIVAQATTWVGEAVASLEASERLLQEFVRYKVERRRIALDTVGAEIFEDCLRRTLDLLRETCYELQAMIR